MNSAAPIRTEPSEVWENPPEAHGTILRAARQKTARALHRLANWLQPAPVNSGRI